MQKSPGHVLESLGRGRLVYSGTDAFSPPVAISVLLVINR
jgi:hypothetical protein